jgi:hypothetical protein
MPTIVHLPNVWAYIYPVTDTANDDVNGAVLGAQVPTSNLSSEAKAAFINVDYYGSDEQFAFMFDDRDLPVDGLTTADISILDSLVAAHVGIPSTVVIPDVIQSGTASVNSTTYTGILTLSAPMTQAGLWLISVSGEVALQNAPIWSAPGPNVLLEGRLVAKQNASDPFVEIQNFTHYFQKWDPRTFSQVYTVNVGASPQVEVQIKTTNASNPARGRRFRISMVLCNVP